MKQSDIIVPKGYKNITYYINLKLKYFPALMVWGKKNSSQCLDQN